MNCPKCDTAIAAPGRFCSKCGHDFGDELHDKFVFYFGLKEEFEKLSRLQNSLNAGISNVSLKVLNYEAILQSDLKAHAPFLRPASATPSPQTPASVPQPAPSAPAPEIRTRQKTGLSDFEVNLGQKWLLIVGILTMVFGVGYFLKYSFEQGWVGPAGRVAAAYLWGAAFLIAGDRFRKQIERFGLSLIGGGIAVLYFAAFAAFQLYHLFGQAPSFGIMVLITVLAGSLAVYYDTKWLAVLGLIGGFLTPVLLTTGQDNQIALMTYMTILNAGLLGIAFHKKWDLLNMLGFAFTYLLYSGWHVSHYAQSKFWPAILFLNLFSLIYSIAPFAYQFLRESRERARGYLIMVPNSFLAFAYSYDMIEDRFSLPWVSVVSLLYAAVFLTMASFLMQKGKQDQEAFVVLLGKAALFLIITIPLIFSGHWITVFWAAQALVLVWMGIKLGRKSLTTAGHVLFLITSLKFLAHDYNSIFRFAADRDRSFLQSYTYLLAERFITTAVLLGTLLAAGLLAARTQLRSVLDDVQDSTVLLALFGGLLFIALNIETSGFFHDYLPAARFAAVSVLWTVFAVVLMLKGVRDNLSLLRKVSFGLFLATLLKVFLSDMSNVSTPYRIVSFIILGLVLVGTSYLYYRFKDRMTPPQGLERTDR
jgi:uncharacterized membrane protein